LLLLQSFVCSNNITVFIFCFIVIYGYEVTVPNYYSYLCKGMETGIVAMFGMQDFSWV